MLTRLKFQAQSIETETLLPRSMGVGTRQSAHGGSESGEACVRRMFETQNKQSVAENKHLMLDSVDLEGRGCTRRKLEGRRDVLGSEKLHVVGRGKGSHVPSPYLLRHPM